MAKKDDTNGSAGATETKEKVPGLFIQSFEPSFRRSGYRFTREGLFIPLGDLDEKTTRTLKNEKRLIVREMDDAPKQA